MTDPSCPPLGELEEFTDANRAFGGVLFFFTLALYAVLIVWWLSRRKKIHLKKRSLRFAILMMLGSLCQAVGTAWVNYNGVETLPCDVHVFVIFLLVPLMAAPLLVRMLQLIYTAKYNQVVVAKSFEGDLQGQFRGRDGVSKFKALAKYLFTLKRFQKQRANTEGRMHRSSTTDIALQAKTTFLFNFGIMMVFVIIALVCIAQKVIPQDSPYFKGCKACFMDESDFKLIAVITFVIIISSLIALYRVRNVADPLRIRFELRLAMLLGLIAAIGNVITAVDPYGLREDRIFDWFYITELFSLAMVLTVTAYPIYLTYSKVSSPEVETFQDVLDSPKLKELFYVYLASEFSVEQLFFVDAVKKYVEDYETASDAVVFERASIIVDTFILDSALLQVNIGHSLRHQILTQFKKARKTKSRISLDIFKDVYNECLSMMADDSFPRFLQSKIYMERDSQQVPEDIVSSIHQSFTPIGEDYEVSSPTPPKLNLNEEP